MTIRFQMPLDRTPDDRGPVWRSLPPAAAAAVLTALLTSSQLQLSMIDHGHEWWRLFLWQLAGPAFWAASAPWILRSGGRFPGFWPPGWLVRELAKCVAFTGVQVFLVAALFLGLQPYVPVASFPFTESLSRALQTWSLLGLLIYFTGLAIGYGVEGHRRARRSELRRSQLDIELMRAQLEALRLQIQPHFLFNTLHSIAALMRRRRNERALEMLLGLSDLLRVTLESSDRQRIPLREELDLVRLYVDLQRARFADRLTVTYEVAESSLEEPVPTLFLQPLVENAIRHGVGPRAAPGHVRIAAVVEGGQLRLTVDDDGVGLPDGFDAERDHGIGLGNTRYRLARLYGEDASVDLRPRPEGGASAVVVLPAEQATGLKAVA